MAHVLIIRLSSFGDVAMLVPVIASVASRYPRDNFTILTRTAFAPLFNNLGFNVDVIHFDTKKHKSLWGLFKLTQRIVTRGFSHVADEHDVLRSKFMRFFLSLSGSKVAKIDKGRAERNAMIASKDTRVAVRHSIDRYFDVLADLGFPADLNFNSILEFSSKDRSAIRSIVGLKKNKWIGIAPFAKHKGKVYPLAKMEKLVQILNGYEEHRIFLLGAGAEENRILNAWAKKYPNVKNISGLFKVDKELELIAKMDVMVSMDSANMHFASLVATPVVSIWGATHPSLGFYGFKQDLKNAIQIDLDCRPCSIFGDLPCARGDYACLEWIDEQVIVDKILELIKN